MDKILIGVPTAEFARRADFYDYFDLIEKPIGTIVTRAHGQSPARNRNLIIQQALERECTHVLFLDDDVCPKPDIINQLLKHNVDMVTGLYLMRQFPHFPIVFDITKSNGESCHSFLNPGRTGLVEVTSGGLGCCLIKTEVFKAMEEPWVRLGELEKDHWCDDLGFFKRARDKGFKLFCDLECICGHIQSMVIWPQRQKGVWYTIYDTNGKGQAIVPQQFPEAEALNKLRKEVYGVSERNQSDK